MSGQSKTIRSITDPVEVDRLLGLSPELVADVANLHSQGRSLDEIIWHLHHHGVTKAGVESALRRSRLYNGADRKIRVHQHPAFADRRAADERFVQQAVELVAEMQPRKRHAA